MIGGAETILKLLKAVEGEYESMGSSTNKRAAVVPWAWSDTEGTMVGQDDTRAQDNGAAAVSAY